MKRKAEARIQAMSAWPHPHDVGSETVFKPAASSKIRTIDDTIAGQDRVEAGHKVFRARSIRCRHQTACYSRGTPRGIHDIQSHSREAATSSGVMRAALAHDFAKYLTDG